MRHYFDPAEKGFKFEYTPKPRAPEPDTGDTRQEVRFLLSPCSIVFSVWKRNVLVPRSQPTLVIAEVYVQN